MMHSDTKAVPTLAVTDLKRARAFYEDLLGLDALGEATGGDMIYQVGEGAYLYVYERPEPAGSTATVCAISVDDVKTTVEKLRSKGAVFEEYDIPEMDLKTIDGIADLNGVKTAWLTDPSGNIIAIEDGMQLAVSKLLSKRKGAERAEATPPA